MSPVCCWRAPWPARAPTAGCSRSATAPPFIYGLLAVGEDWDFLNINGADNVLHLATALVGLVIALMPVRTAVSDHTHT